MRYQITLIEIYFKYRFALRPAVLKISHILNFPNDYHVKCSPKKNKTNIAKDLKFQFHYSFINFGRDPPQEYTWILGSKSSMFFQRRCHLNFFYSLMLKKTKQKS